MFKQCNDFIKKKNVLYKHQYDFQEGKYTMQSLTYTQISLIR